MNDIDPEYAIYQKIAKARYNEYKKMASKTAKEARKSAVLAAKKKTRLLRLALDAKIQELIILRDAVAQPSFMIGGTYDCVRIQRQYVAEITHDSVFVDCNHLLSSVNKKIQNRFGRKKISREVKSISLVTLIRFKLITLKKYIFSSNVRLVVFSMIIVTIFAIIINYLEKTKEKLKKFIGFLIKYVSFRGILYLTLELLKN